jgi:hypothetical protein
VSLRNGGGVLGGVPDGRMPFFVTQGTGTGVALLLLLCGRTRAVVGSKPWAGRMLRYLAVVATLMVVACHGPAREAGGSPTAVAGEDEPVDENRPAQPLNKELSAPRGGVMVTVSNWVLRYEGTISDGRPRFLESILSGDAKDVVFDTKHSALYPFGNYGIKILRFDQNSVSYIIETTD